MKKYILITAIASLTLVGCKDFLVEDPILSQSTELTMATFTGLNNAIAGAYSPLADGVWYGPGFVLESEMRSGNGKKPTIGAFDSGRYTVPYLLNYNESTTSGLWGYAYFVISAVNNVLDNMEGKENESGVTQEMINNLKAESLFLRALSHFDLVRLYAQPYTYDPNGPGVPVVLHTDPAGMPARNTVKEVYDQIVSDLLEAENLMSDSYTRSNAQDPSAVASKPAIQALLSRVYLYMGEWQKCADYSTKVINNSKFSMWTANELPNVWGVDIPSGGEVIFELYGLKSNSYDEYWEGPAYMTSPDGYADVAASNDLVNLYEEGDVRGSLFQTHPDGPGLYWTSKYIGKGKGTPDVNNVIILRLSEMYLNRAEAIVNGASVAGTSAVSDLNTITSNRGAAEYTSAGKEDVFQERRKELAFEGHLWFDYPRCGRGMVRNDYTGTDVTNKNIPFPDYRWALPIAKRELDVNENLVQNEGY